MTQTVTDLQLRSYFPPKSMDRSKKPILPNKTFSNPRQIFFNQLMYKVMRKRGLLRKKSTRVKVMLPRHTLLSEKRHFKQLSSLHALKLEFTMNLCGWFVPTADWLLGADNFSSIARNLRDFHWVSAAEQVDDSDDEDEDDNDNESENDGNGPLKCLKKLKAVLNRLVALENLTLDFSRTMLNDKFVEVLSEGFKPIRSLKKLRFMLPHACSLKNLSMRLQDMLVKGRKRVEELHLDLKGCKISAGDVDFPVLVNTVGRIEGLKKLHLCVDGSCVTYESMNELKSKLKDSQQLEELSLSVKGVREPMKETVRKQLEEIVQGMRDVKKRAFFELESEQAVRRDMWGRL